MLTTKLTSANTHSICTMMCSMLQGELFQWARFESLLPITYRNQSSGEDEEAQQLR